MNAEYFSEKAILLTEVSPFVYGTDCLSDESIPFEERVEIAQAAIDTGVWFHTSTLNKEALKVLKNAFDQDRLKVPKLIVKLEGQSIDQFKVDVRNSIEALGINNIALGQLSLKGELAEDFAKGGSCLKEFEMLRKNGVVNNLVLDVSPWDSDIAVKAVKRGTKDVVEGFIFNLNPLQRFVSNQLWELVRERSEPIISLNTLAGGDLYLLRDEPGFAKHEYLQKRAFEVAPIFEKSGIESWTEFCIRFAHSFSQVRATVDSTAKGENLQEFLMVSELIEPLPYDIVDAIVKLQYRWSDELDSQAKEGSL